MAAAARAARRRDAPRARRLPDRQRDLPSDRAARARGARLGAVHARSPAVGLRVSGDGVAPRAGGVPRASRAATSRRWASRPRTSTSPPIAGAPAATAIAHWDVYLIFNMFRIAAILHGVLARALQGNAASANAIETGGRARLVAEVAWRMAQAQGADGARLTRPVITGRPGACRGRTLLFHSSEQNQGSPLRPGAECVH